jgi:hypothetical protein
MDCSPDDEELLSLVLGERRLSIERQAHLKQCVQCQQRLAEIQHVNTILLSRLYRIFCPSSMDISLYCADLLPSAATFSIVKHVLNCPLCTREVAETRTFIKVRDLEPAFAPLAAMRRVIGILLGPQLQLATRGVARSVAQAIWSHQYRAGDINLSLHLMPSSNNDYVLLGVLGSADSENGEDLFEGAEAVIGAGSSLAATAQISLPETEPVLRTLVDDLGNFAFASIARGEYTLIIHLPDRDVVIEQITIEQT